MNPHARIGAHFDRKAASFDAVYSGRAGVARRWWDRVVRENVRWRLQFTLEAAGPLEGRRVLDVGCGSGRYCLAMARRGAAEVIGLDLAPGMLEIARSLAEEQGVDGRCRFVQADFLDFSSREPFDVVTAIGLFDYLPDPLGALRHLRGLTAGRLVAAFPARWALRAPARKLWWLMKGCVVRFYTRQAIRGLCRDARFCPECLVQHGPIYMLVARPGAG